MGIALKESPAHSRDAPETDDEGVPVLRGVHIHGCGWQAFLPYRFPSGTSLTFRRSGSIESFFLCSHGIEKGRRRPLADDS